MKIENKYTKLRRTHVFVAAAIVFLCPTLSFAQSARFKTNQDGIDLDLATRSVVIQAVDYISLSELVNQLGGAINVQPSRVRIDLGNTTAYIKPDNNRVNALSLFSLKHPIHEEDGSYWISSEDVSSFFLKSFRLEIQSEAPRPTMDNELAESPPSLTELESFESQEPISLPQATPIGSRFETILIDPGHGGVDAGIQSDSGLAEKELTLAIALKLVRALQANVGQTVILTRQDDLLLSNDNRMRLARNVKDALVISIHAAYEPSATWGGIGLYRHAAPDETPNSKLTDEASAALSASLADVLRYAFPAKSIIESALPLQAFSLSERPGILIEVGFLSNPAEAGQLADEEYQSRMAAVISDGLLAFLRGEIETQVPETSLTDSPNSVFKTIGPTENTP